MISTRSRPASRSVHVPRLAPTRGTAAGVRCPRTGIWRRDPHAVVTVFPADHFVLEEDTFMTHAGSWSRPTWARSRTGWCPRSARPPTPTPTTAGLSGARAWDGRARTRCGGSVVSARSPPRTRRGGCSRWAPSGNTLVLAARVDALVEAGRPCLPLPHDRPGAHGPLHRHPVRDVGPSARPTSSPPPRISAGGSGNPRARPPVAEAPAHTWCDLAPRRASRGRSRPSAPRWPGS